MGGVSYCDPRNQFSPKCTQATFICTGRSGEAKIKLKKKGLRNAVSDDLACVFRYAPYRSAVGGALLRYLCPSIDVWQ